MARKKGEKYFNIFVELVQYSCDAAALLYEIVSNFHPEDLAQAMARMHQIEQAGDAGRHRMMENLAREFITPIEREDIMAMADAIDNVTDTIEDVLMRIYMFNFTTLREDAIKMAAIIVKCCEALKEALREFGNFRKSETLRDLVIEINRLEEEGDTLFVEATRSLYAGREDPVEIIAWSQTLDYLEKSCDACEEVSAVIENVMLKNS